MPRTNGPGETASEQRKTANNPGVLKDDETVLLGDLILGEGADVPRRDDVEPYLAALFQSEHLNLLVGSGLTVGLASLLGSSWIAEGSDEPRIEDEDHERAIEVPDMNAELQIEGQLASAIEEAAQLSACHAGRGAPNIEDRLRIAIAIEEGLRHLGDERADVLQRCIGSTLEDLRNSVSSTEAALGNHQSEVVLDNMSLQGVLMSFLGSFAARVPTRDRLHIFTTNYDRVIEWGAELAGLRIVDRFVGSLRPAFRSSHLEIDYHYSPPGTVRDPRHLDGVFRLTKLHGSIDWEWEAESRRIVRAALPFGRAPATASRDTLIYPNASKDVETTHYPYADLFRDMSAALCRPHSVLITYGYSFGDDHINRVIKDMLTIPSTHLLIISWDDPSKRIRKFAQDHRRLGQVSLLIGPTIAGLPALIGCWLPSPSAEFLLQRRAQIYRQRDTDRAGDGSSERQDA